MHPNDFSTICTTELSEAMRLKNDFRERGVRICCFSCDSPEDHRRWIADIRAATGVTPDFPMFSDTARVYADQLGVMDSHLTSTTGQPTIYRNAYILKPDKTIVMMTTYPVTTGRNYEEIIRVLDSLQLTVNMNVVTPANWKSGDDVLIDTSLTDQQADDLFGKDGYRTEVLPSEKGRQVATHYMRWVKDPSYFPPEGS